MKDSFIPPLPDISSSLNKVINSADTAAASKSEVTAVLKVIQWRGMFAIII